MSEKMNRREFLPMVGVSLVSTPFLLSSCDSGGTTSIDKTIDLPGTVVFSSSVSGRWHIYASDFNSETILNITGAMSGNHRHPVFGSDGSVFFDSNNGTNWGDDGTLSSINMVRDLNNPQTSLETLISGGYNMMPEFINSELVYIDADNSNNKVIRAYDSGSNTELAITSGAIKNYQHIPATNSAIVTSSVGLHVLDLSGPTYEAYGFGNVPISSIPESIEFTTIDNSHNAFCTGVRPTSDFFYAFYTWDFDNPFTPSRRASASEPQAHKWYDLRCKLINGENYLLFSYQGSFIGTGDKEAAVIMTRDILNNLDWTPSSMEQAGNNRWPDWVDIEITDL